jgi:hypothetical protein
MLPTFGLVLWFALQRVASGAGENQVMILAKVENTDGRSKSIVATLHLFCTLTQPPMTLPPQNVVDSTPIYSSRHLKRVRYLWTASKTSATKPTAEDFTSKTVPK